MGNAWYAVECTNASNNLIGGTNVAAGNRLAFSQLNNGYGCPGARIRGGSTNVAILCNAIFSNLGLGIDLGTYGVNLNIACDTLGGDNMLQNYPVLTQAVSGNGTGVRGTLNSRPNDTFLLQFFANPTCDGSGSTSFSDAFFENLTILGFFVIHQNVAIDWLIKLATTGVDAAFAEHGFHTEGAGFVRNDRNNVLADIRKFEQRFQNCYKGAGGRGFAAA